MTPDRFEKIRRKVEATAKPDLLVSTAVMRELVEDNRRLREALEALLSDVESTVDFGMPFEDEGHGFHESWTKANAALGNGPCG